MGQQQNKRKDVLSVIRFSALGDCLMLATVLEEFTEHYPKVPLLVVTRRNALPYFSLNTNTDVLALEDFDNNVLRLARHINTHYHLMAVADMHNNLRSNYLKVLLRIMYPLVTQRAIFKGRAEKKNLTRLKNKRLVQLQPGTERYADVLRKLGYAFSLTHNRLQAKQRHIAMETQGAALLEKLGATKPYVGVAPFARHAPKEIPYAWLAAFIRQLNKRGIVPVLFGGGEREKMAAAHLAAECRICNAIGCFNKVDELAGIYALDVMVTADSANMHLASFAGTRVISLWGPTHPFAGFMGYGQRYGDALQAEDERRPNSVFGNKELLKNGLPIMVDINIDKVVSAVLAACGVPK